MQPRYPRDTHIGFPKCSAVDVIQLSLEAIGLYERLAALGERLALLGK